MSRLRWGFPLLVTMLLALFLALATNLTWLRAAESETALSTNPNVSMAASTGAQAASPLLQSSPLPAPAGAPSAVIEATLINNDRRQIWVSFHFDRPMDKESVEAALQVLPPDDTFQIWEENTLTVGHSRPLPFNELFTALISTAATDSNGVPLAAELRYDWWVPPLWATVTLPKLNDRGEPLAMSFSYALDGPSVLEALRITPAIPGNIQWDEENHQLLIYPDPPLPENTTYLFHFEGKIVDLYGQVVEAPQPGSFTTAPPFSMPAELYPRHPALPLRLTFDRAMDQETTAAALTISPPISLTQSWVGNTLILTPISGAFLPNTQYQITLEPTATSVDGDFVLTAPYRVDLLMGEFTLLGDFGYGPNLQVLLADGPRMVQYQTIGIDAAHEFTLYTLTREQFIASYVESFGMMDARVQPTIALEGAERVAAWQEAGGRSGEESQGEMVQHETMLPADLPPGLYVLEMKVRSTQVQIFVVLTHHTVLLKQGTSDVVAWLTNSSGEPAAGAKAVIYDREGAVINTATSDEKGLFRASLETGGMPLLLLAEVENGKGEQEVAVAGFDAGWESRTSSWGWGWSPPPAAPRAYAVHLYSDRPIYRPGQTLYYKAIIRSDDDARLSLPSQQLSVTVRLRDARNNVVRTVSHTPNGFGTVNGKFEIAQGAMVGSYALELEVEGEVFRYGFLVQEYRKPDFTVEVNTHAPVYARGEDVVIEVNSRFLWGEPLANATVKWQRFYLYPEGSIGTPTVALLGDSGESLMTDEDGYLRITRPASDFDTTGSYFPAGGQWGIEVTVEDEAHQSASASTLIHFVERAEQIQVTAPAYQLVNQPFTAVVTVTDTMGEPVAGKEIQVNLGREHLPTATSGVEFTTSVTTLADGRAEVELTMPEAGDYHIWATEIAAPPTDGTSYTQAPASGYASVIVIDPQTVPTDPYGIYSPFVVTLDRTTYAPGDEAEIIIFSRFGGPALVTMERGEVGRVQLVELTPPLTVVTTTITPEDAPNIFVTVNGWERLAEVASVEEEQRARAGAPDLSHPDAFLHNRSVELHVPALDKTLLITLTADQTHYAPRQDATFAITVTERSGQPVEAELSLALVDEAIFTLADDQSGAIYDAFYFGRGHTVKSFDSMAPARYLYPNGGGGGGGGGLDFNRPRYDFRDTVLWLPNVETGADGTAEVTLTLPDNLTTWRLTVKATTGESTQVGEATTTITTWQPLVVRPLLPRGITVGDEVTLSATLHNESDTPQEATVWLEPASSLLQLSVPATQTVTLAPGEVRVVGWPVKAMAAGSISVTISALTTGGLPLYDAVESTFKINPLAVADRTTEAGRFDEIWETTIHVPEGTLPASHLYIELNRSVAGSFVSGLEFLTGFPYGCVEQTMSRALPNAVVSRAFRLLGVNDSILHPDLAGLVNASVQRLYGFQHLDGGWGWWYDDVSEAYQTAWVLYGLAMTSQSGYEIDPAVMGRGVTWLTSRLPGMESRTLAFVLYSMALVDPLLPVETSLNDGEIFLEQSPRESVAEIGVALLDRLEELDAFSLAALALALDAAGEEDGAQAVMERLLAGVTEDEETAHWSLAQPDGHYEQKTMASSTRSTALALSALLKIAPDHPLIPKIAAWLMDRRQAQGWGSTNETAFALVALTDYLLATEQVEGGSDYVVEVNGAEVASGRLDEANSSGSVVIPVSQLAVGDNQVRLRHSGDAPLYYKVSQDFVVEQANLEATGSIRLERHYEDAATGELLDTVAAGQLVRVVLDVGMPEPGFYMVIEDSVPGGLEPLNESLNTTSYIASADALSLYAYNYNYKEIYQDRVRLFVTQMEGTSHRFSYLARATHTGTFVALPTEAWAMYNPQLWGRSASQEVVVTETQEPEAIAPGYKRRPLKRALAHYTP